MRKTWRIKHQEGAAIQPPDPVRILIEQELLLVRARRLMIKHKRWYSFVSIEQLADINSIITYINIMSQPGAKSLDPFAFSRDLVSAC